MCGGGGGREGGATASTDESFCATADRNAASASSFEAPVASTPSSSLRAENPSSVFMIR